MILFSTNDSIFTRFPPNIEQKEEAESKEVDEEEI